MDFKLKKIVRAGGFIIIVVKLFLSMDSSLQKYVRAGYFIILKYFYQEKKHTGGTLYNIIINFGCRKKIRGGILLARNKPFRKT